MMKDILTRYHRQIMLDGWGADTQQRLKNSRVFIAGIGGLGCPVALSLALAGVGHIRICDSDRVEITNLNRQFFYREANIGSKKPISAQEFLKGVNPDVNIETIFERIHEQNVDQLVADAQVIIDCLDNFQARYAVNQCAIRKGVPLVHGAVWGMEGRVTVFHPPETACLSCIFPKAPARGEIPVLGAVTSAIGSMQAIQAIQYLIGAEVPLMGKMLIVDFAAMRFQELEVPRDPTCNTCAG